MAHTPKRDSAHRRETPDQSCGGVSQWGEYTPLLVGEQFRGCVDIAAWSCPERVGTRVGSLSRAVALHPHAGRAELASALPEPGGRPSLVHAGGQRRKDNMHTTVALGMNVCRYCLQKGLLVLFH